MLPTCTSALPNRSTARSGASFKDRHTTRQHTVPSTSTSKRVSPGVGLFVLSSWQQLADDSAVQLVRTQLGQLGASRASTMASFAIVAPIGQIEADRFHSIGGRNSGHMLRSIWARSSNFTMGAVARRRKEAPHRYAPKSGCVWWGGAPWFSYTYTHTLIHLKNSSISCLPPVMGHLFSHSHIAPLFSRGD